MCVTSEKQEKNRTVIEAKLKWNEGKGKTINENDKTIIENNEAS